MNKPCIGGTKDKELIFSRVGRDIFGVGGEEYSVVIVPFSHLRSSGQLGGSGDASIDTLAVPHLSK